MVRNYCGSDVADAAHHN